MVHNGSFCRRTLRAGSIDRYRPATIAEPVHGAIDRGIWMIASRSDSEHVIGINLDGHCARDALRISPVLGAPQDETSVPNPAGVDHLRQDSKQVVLRIGAGLL